MAETVTLPSLLTSGKSVEEPRSKLSELASQAEILLKKLAPSDTPKLHYNLPQIEERAQNFGIKSGTAQNDANFTKAHYLLAESGVNLSQNLQDLNDLDFSQTFQELVMPHTKIESLLNVQREQNIMTEIYEAFLQSEREFDAYLEEVAASNWEKKKQEMIFDSLHERYGDESGKRDEKVDNSVKLLQNISFVDVELHLKNKQSDVEYVETQKQYSEPIRKYTEARLLTTEFDLCEEIIKSIGVYTRRSDHATMQLHAIWKIVSKILAPSPETDALEKKYRSIYNGPEDTPQHSVLRRKIINGARRFLEEQCYEFVEAEISNNIFESKIGGIPSVTNKLMGFLKYRYYTNDDWSLPNVEIVNNIPIWALVFWLFRTGHVEEATTWATQHEKWFQLIDRSFIVYLKAYNATFGRLPRQLLERVRAEFNQKLRFKQDIDPYKYGLYKILGRCDLSQSSLPKILPLTEDWMWLQLMLVQESVDTSEVPEFDLYSLKDLQSKVSLAGSRHFNPHGATPLIYVHVLLLCGQFEKAVHYFYQYYQIDAVHLAVVLYANGLLHSTTDYKETSLLVSHNDVIVLNYPRLLLSYTGQFKQVDVELTIAYISLLVIHPDKAMLRLSHETLADLILSTQDLSRLLGDITPSGDLDKGVFQKNSKLFELADDKNFMHDITFQAAVKAEKEDKYSDSVLLYHYAEEFDFALKTVNKYLSESLVMSEMLYKPEIISKDMHNASEDTLKAFSFQMIDSPVSLAQNIFQIYTSNPNIAAKLSAEARSSCGKLLNILEAYQLYRQSNWEACLDQIDLLNLLPMKGEDVAKSRNRALKLINVDPVLTRQVSGLLVICMQSIFYLAHQCKSSSFKDATKQQFLMMLKEKSKNLVVFTANIEYQIPSSLTEEINRIDVLI